MDAVLQTQVRRRFGAFLEILYNFGFCDQEKIRPTFTINGHFHHLKTAKNF
jgi:hypothetical protein